MKTVTVKILQILLSIMVLVVVGNQIYRKNMEKPETEQAILYNVTSNISFKGIFVRDEKVIDADFDGVVSYNFDNGSKVLADSIVAEIYDDYSQIQAKSRIEMLKNELTLLERAQNPGTTAVAQPEFLTEQIDEKFKLINSYLDLGDFKSAAKEKQDMSVVMNIYNIITNYEVNFSERIQNINEEIDTLNAVIGQPKQSIKINDAGYFMSYSDGYEKELTTDSVGNMTVEDIEKILSLNVSRLDNTVGKMLTNHNSKIVGIAENANLILGRNDLSVTIGDSNTLIDVKVQDAKKIGDTNKYIVILDMYSLEKDFLDSRIKDINIFLGEYSGLKVPKEAITFNDKGEKGVYISLGSNYYFRKIDVIYEANDIAISRLNTSSEYLALYDNILLGGVNIDESAVAE